MKYISNDKNRAFEDGVLTRSQGYSKQFNPFRHQKTDLLYKEWLKGWANQNNLMS